MLVLAFLLPWMDELVTGQKQLCINIWLWVHLIQLKSMNKCLPSTLLTSPYTGLGYFPGSILVCWVSWICWAKHVPSQRILSGLKIHGKGRTGASTSSHLRVPPYRVPAADRYPIQRRTRKKIWYFRLFWTLRVPSQWTKWLSSAGLFPSLVK